MYDCPHLTLYSTTVTNDCNYFFLFDKNLVKLVQTQGGKHVYHLPLGANFSRISKKFSIQDETYDSFLPLHYEYDLSFVGSLYENNIYRQVNSLPDELIGYIDGLLDSQSLFPGTELIEDFISSGLGEKLNTYIQLESTNAYTYTSNNIYLQMLQKELTARERICYLQSLAQHHSLTLFSGSSKSLCPAADHGGYISYEETMPYVFRHSKINLNISLRSITSGIPLRAIDILASGGFLLTNDQPELSNFLINGEDYIGYHNQEDLLAKVDYFLSHEKERKEISYQGYKHAKLQFTYDNLLSKLLKTLSQHH